MITLLNVLLTLWIIISNYKIRIDIEKFIELGKESLNNLEKDQKYYRNIIDSKQNTIDDLNQRIKNYQEWISKLERECN